MEKLLTIIVPTYNMEKYLRRCLDSLIIGDEGMRLLEVLVINDGSKDSSSSIAHEYQEKYTDTFRVIDKENGNYGSCINRGLRESNGKYIRILDADDFFDTENFKRYLMLLSEINVDLVLTDFEYVDMKAIVLRNHSRNLSTKSILSFDEAAISFLDQTIAMHEVTYKKDILVECGYYQTEGVSYTDTEWCIYPVPFIHNLYYTGISVYKYLIGRPGQTMEKTTFEKSINQRLKIQERAFENYTSLVQVCSKAQKMYLTNLLIKWASDSYRYYLLVSKKILFEDIDKYEECLMIHAPAIYNSVSECRILHMKYIHTWRHRTNNNQSPFLIRLMRMAFSIKNIMYRLCQK